MPPFFIVHGRVDDIVPVNQALLLDEALRRVGTDVTLRIIEGAGHDFNQIHDGDLVYAFFTRTLSQEMSDCCQKSDI